MPKFAAHLSPLRLVRSRMLRPFARHLLDRRLWQASPSSLGRGMAIGFFFGILVPVGQIFCAAGLAVLLRANLLTATSATLISNPLTFPPIYYLAWQIGRLVKSWLPAGTAEEAAHLATEAHVVSDGWLAGLGTTGGELLLGLLVLAPLAACLGYLAGRCLGSVLGLIRSVPKKETA